MKSTKVKLSDQKDTARTRRQETTANIVEPSYSIGTFCIAEAISRPTYFKMREAGLGPEELRYLRVVRITHAARLEWHKRLMSGEIAEAMALKAADMKAQSNVAAAKAAQSPNHVANIRAAARAAGAARGVGGKAGRKRAAQASV